MSQFTLYKNNDKSTASTYPYFVDVQSELLDSLNTRLVIPLTPIELLKKKPLAICVLQSILTKVTLRFLLNKWLAFQLNSLRPQSTS